MSTDVINSMKIDALEEEVKSLASSVNDIRMYIDELTAAFYISEISLYGENARILQDNILLSRIVRTHTACSDTRINGRVLQYYIQNGLPVGEFFSLVYGINPDVDWASVITLGDIELVTNAKSAIEGSNAKGAIDYVGRARQGQQESL